MRFSVIVPVYNTREYLSASVSSVLGQTCGDFELILSDDGSTDGSGPLCDALATQDSRIRVLHGPNTGAGRARNRALDQAQGEFVLFLDSDDTLVPDALERLDEHIGRTGADVYFFRLRRITAAGESIQPPEAEAGGPVSLSQDPSILLRWGAGAGGALWRRALFESRSDIRFGPWRVGEDLYMTRRMLAIADSAVQLPDVLYNYYIRSQSATQGSLDGGRDVMAAMDGILDWYRREGLFARYEPELCALCVLHVLVYASWRVLDMPGSGPVLDELRDYTKARFPLCRRNKYVRSWPLSRRVNLRLLEWGLYPVLRGKSRR